MTDADLNKLEALAKAAGGKEWRLGGGGFVAEGDAPIADFLAMPDPDDWKSGPSIGDAVDRAKFVAAANPATILDLIASARRDAEEIERLRAALRHYTCSCEPGRCAMSLEDDDTAVDDQLCGRTAQIALTARAAHTGEG